MSNGISIKVMSPFSPEYLYLDPTGLKKLGLWYGITNLPALCYLFINTLK